jgi:hypothetical protein
MQELIRRSRTSGITLQTTLHSRPRSSSRGRKPSNSTLGKQSNTPSSPSQPTSTTLNGRLPRTPGGFPGLTFSASSTSPPPLPSLTECTSQEKTSLLSTTWVAEHSTFLSLSSRVASSRSNRPTVTLTSVARTSILPLSSTSLPTSRRIPASISQTTPWLYSAFEKLPRRRKSSFLQPPKPKSTYHSSAWTLPVRSISTSSSSVPSSSPSSTPSFNAPLTHARRPPVMPA